MKNVYFFFLVFLMSYSCNTAIQEATISKDSMSTKSYKDTGSIEVFDPALLSLVDSSAKIEILAEGFKWTEGPLWIADSNYLLFSDIPPNTVMKWDEKNGVTPYLFPSGYTGTIPRGGEPGANGLILDQQGRLVLCQHGDRKMARMDAPLDLPSPKYITIADQYDGKKLNSPNDAVYHSNGDLYFTDPPYGLLNNMNDSSKELNFQGVFRVKKDGKVDLLTKELSRPNGIAFSRDEKKLFVANSDVNKIWMSYDVTPEGGIANGKVFYDATAVNEPGSPDGMKVHSSGNIFATGPGGVLVFSPAGKLIGKIRVGDLCSNCAFDANEKYLYITANHWLVRVKLK